MFVLAIDLGTSGLKTALVDETGGLAATTARPVDTIHIPPHGAEQDAEAIWASVIDSCREVLRAVRPAPESVAAISCTSQYFSLIPVDRHGVPLSNLILWLDSRGRPHTHRLYGEHDDVFGQWVEIHGMVPLPTGNDSLSHLFWLQNERPDLYDRAFSFLEPADYLVSRFTGEPASSPASAFPLLLTDNRDLSCLEYSRRLVGLAGVDAAKLPPLLPTGSIAGTVQRSVAEALGLLTTTPIFTAINDTQAVGVGTGSFLHGRGAINLGTTSQVLAHLGEKKSDLEHALISMPSAIPGRYMVMAENGLGGKPLEHFLRGFVFANDPLGDHSHEDPFRFVDEAVSSVPPGSDGLLFLPWLTGAQAPESHSPTRGGFLNLGLSHGRAHFTRAILEGVACNMRWVLPHVESFVNQNLTELLFSGGGASSAAWAQIMADVVQRPISQLSEPRYVNTRAAAFLAFVHLGRQSLDEIASFCPIRARFEPNPANHALYDRQFEHLLKAFESNRDLYDSMNRPAD